MNSMINFNNDFPLNLEMHEFEFKFKFWLSNLESAI